MTINPLIANGRLTRRTLLAAACVARCRTAFGEAVAGSSEHGLLGHIRHGEGAEPVVVLHEWMGDHSNYDLLLPFLPEDRYSWVLADLRGYGLSKAMTGAYGLEEASGDVLRLMDGLGFQRFHVVGHSMSGLIAQYLAKRGGSRIKSAVLISPVPASGFRANEEAKRKLLAVIEDDEAARAAILARGGTRYGRGWLERKLAMTRRAGTPEAMRGYLAMFTGSDITEEVRGLDIPITVLCGEDDLPLYREASIRALLGPLYPQLEIAVSHEAGHYAMLETPPLVAGTLEKGIARGI